MLASVPFLFAAHATCSVSMVLLNKSLATDFDYPWTVVFVQNVGTVLLGFLPTICSACWGGEGGRGGSDGTNGSGKGTGTGPGEDGPRKFCGLQIPRRFKNKLWCVLQMIFFILTLYFSLKALRYMTVPLYVVARNTVPAATAGMEFCYSKIRLKKVAILGLFLTVVGAVLYATGDYFMSLAAKSSNANAASTSVAGALPVDAVGLTYAVFLIFIVSACSVIDKTAVHVLKDEEGMTPVTCNQNRCFLSLPFNFLLILLFELYKENAKPKRQLGEAGAGLLLGESFGDGSGIFGNSESWNYHNQEQDAERIVPGSRATCSSSSFSSAGFYGGVFEHDWWQMTPTPQQEEFSRAAAVLAHPQRHLFATPSSVAGSGGAEPAPASGVEASSRLDPFSSSAASSTPSTSLYFNTHPASYPPLVNSFLDLSTQLHACLFLSTIFGFGIGTFNFYLQQALTAATVQVANILYKLTTTVLSRVTHPAPVAFSSWCGFGLSLLGIGLYTFGNQITELLFGPPEEAEFGTTVVGATPARGGKMRAKTPGGVDEDDEDHLEIEVDGSVDGDAGGAIEMKNVEDDSERLMNGDDVETRTDRSFSSPTKTGRPVGKFLE